MDAVFAGFGRIALIVQAIRHQQVFVSSGGIEYELQFLHTSGILRRTSRCITTRRNVGRIEDSMSRMGRCIRHDVKCGVVLVCADIHLTILDTFSINDIVIRQFDSYYVFIEGLLFDIGICGIK